MQIAASYASLGRSSGSNRPNRPSRQIVRIVPADGLRLPCGKTYRGRGCFRPLYAGPLPCSLELACWSFSLRSTYHPHDTMQCELCKACNCSHTTSIFINHRRRWKTVRQGVGRGSRPRCSREAGRAWPCGSHPFWELLHLRVSETCASRHPYPWHGKDEDRPVDSLDDQKSPGWSC
jgi:hypothetical protein